LSFAKVAIISCAEMVSFKINPATFSSHRSSISSTTIDASTAQVSFPLSSRFASSLCRLECPDFSELPVLKAHHSVLTFGDAD